MRSAFVLSQAYFEVLILSLPLSLPPFHGIIRDYFYRHPVPSFGYVRSFVSSFLFYFFFFSLKKKVNDFISDNKIDNNIPPFHYIIRDYFYQHPVPFLGYVYSFHLFLLFIFIFIFEKKFNDFISDYKIDNKRDIAIIN